MTVYIVDDNHQFHERIKSCLSLEPGIQIVGETRDGENAVRETMKLRPDVVLMDVRLPSMNGMAAAIRIIKHSPETRLIILSQNENDATRQAPSERGMNGYVVKNKPDLGVHFNAVG